jgi:hypothetical protein
VVNYGGDGLVLLDTWMGTWHDGSKDGDRRMRARYEEKLARSAWSAAGRSTGCDGQLGDALQRRRARGRR